MAARLPRGFGDGWGVSQALAGFVTTLPGMSGARDDHPPLRLKIYPPQQVGETGLGAQAIEFGICLQIHQGWSDLRTPCLR